MLSCPVGTDPALMPPYPSVPPTLESCLCSLAGRCHLYHRKGAPVHDLSRGWCAPAPPPAWAGNVLSVHRQRCAFWAGTFPPELLQRARDTTRQWISHGPVSLMNLSLSERSTSMAQGCLWFGLPGGLGTSSSILASCSCWQSMAWQRQRRGASTLLNGHFAPLGAEMGRCS